MTGVGPEHLQAASPLPLALSGPTPRHARLGRTALAVGLGLTCLLLGIAAYEFNSGTANVNELEELRDHGTNGLATLAYRSRFRNGRHVTYHYEIDGGRYSARVQSRALYDGFRKGGQIPIVYSKLHPAISRPGRREALRLQAIAEARRNRWFLPVLASAAALIFGVVYSRRMAGYLHLARVGHAQWATVTHVDHDWKGHRLGLMIHDHLGLRVHEAPIPKASAKRYAPDKQVVVLADPTEPERIGLYDSIRKWVVV